METQVLLDTNTIMKDREIDEEILPLYQEKQNNSSFDAAVISEDYSEPNQFFNSENDYSFIVLNKKQSEHGSEAVANKKFDVNQTGSPRETDLKKLKYDDDEEIEALVAKGGGYDYEQCLKLELKSDPKCFPIDHPTPYELHVVLTIKSEEGLFKETSLGKDLIFLIDTSLSMSGQKLVNVQRSMGLIIDALTANDRVCLITFNQSPSRLTPFLKCSEKGRKELKSKIFNIETKRGTSIVPGVEMALEALLARRQANDIASIFLLTDGEDNYRNKYSISQKVHGLLESKGLGRVPKEGRPSFTINCFGYGKDHDAVLMREIANFKDGNFYFISQYENIAQCFRNAFAGLVTTILKDIKIKVSLSPEGIPGLRIIKTFGSQWNSASGPGSAELFLNHFIKGVSRDFIFSVELPAQLNRKEILVQAELIGTKTDYRSKGLMTIKNMQTKLEINGANMSEEELRKCEKNGEVLLQKLRVEAAEAIEIAISKADEKNFAEGENALNKIIQKIDNLGSEDNELTTTLRKHLKFCKDSTVSSKYNSTARSQLNEIQAIHMNQGSSDKINLYSNELQKNSSNSSEFR